VRWLVAACWVAACYLALTALALPQFFEALGWTWGSVWIGAFSLIATGLLTLAQRPTQQRLAADVAGLSRPQRSQIITALRGGDAPADPRVLAAAIRVGALSMAYRRRTSRSQRIVTWLIPALLIVATVLSLVGNDARLAAVWAGLALIVIARVVWLSRRARRLEKNLETLRAAARATGTSWGDDEDPAALPPPRLWVVALVAVIGGVGVGAAMVFGSTRSTPDCRTADAAVNFVAAHRDMLDSNLIGPGGPSLDKYRDWSNQLRDYSRQVSAGKLALHLHRIADMSQQAVSVVRQARPDPPASISPDVLDDLRLTYQEITNQLVEEDNALVPICHPRH
jgi:hypothetical protein